MCVLRGILLCKTLCWRAKETKYQTVGFRAQYFQNTEFENTALAPGFYNDYLMWFR